MSLRSFPNIRRVALHLILCAGLLGSALTVAGGESGYDPAADPAADLKVASAEARESGKRILLKVGGEWCSWCRLMDKFIHENAAVESLLSEGFVVLKVNFSEENKNEAFLGRFPKISGYPHLFVLDADGELLHSQDTAELESGKGYSKDAFTTFLKTWSPDGKDPAGRR